MSLKIRMLFEPRLSIAYAIEDPETGHFYDFKSGNFDSTPANATQLLVEDWVAKARGNSSLNFLRGAYANVSPDDPAVIQLETPKGIFRAGLYTIYFIDASDVDRAVDIQNWVAEEVGDGIELRPQGSAPMPASGLVPPPQPMPAPAPTPPGISYTFNIPPDLRIEGSTAIRLVLPSPDDGATPAPTSAPPTTQTPPDLMPGPG